jgi:hypothetical protein
MTTRRKFLSAILPAFVALGLIAGAAFADELFGVLTEVDIEGHKVTVVEKGTDKEVLVTVTEDTEYVTPKGSGKVQLKKVAKAVEKAKEKGNKGVQVKVEHKAGVASKITAAPRKKAEPKN